jgi:hypothetical protein
MTKSTPRNQRTVSLSGEAHEMIKRLRRLGIKFNVSEACSQAIVTKGKRAIFRTERNLRNTLAAIEKEAWCPGDKLGGVCPGIESEVNSDCPKWKEGGER